jgi:hypothetical protein
VLGSAAAILAALLFANALMQSDRADNVWGAYWYNVFVIVPLVYFLTRISAAANWTNGLRLVFCISLALCATVFPQTNRAYRDFHYYHPDQGPIHLKHVFAGEVDRFSLAPVDRRDIRQSIGAIEAAQQDSRIEWIPVELAPLLLERRSVRAPVQCPSGHFSGRPIPGGLDCEPTAK